jgi:hypothetical protein
MWRSFFAWYGIPEGKSTTVFNSWDIFVVKMTPFKVKMVKLCMKMK